MELIIAVWLTLLITVPVWSKDLGANEAMSGIIYAIMFTITIVVWIWMDEAERAEKERINQLFDKIDEAMYDLECKSYSKERPMKNISPLLPNDEEIEKDIEDVKRTVIKLGDLHGYTNGCS